MSHQTSHREILRRVARHAMLARQLQPDFPAAALQQLAGIVRPAAPTAPAGPPVGAVTDFRDLRGLLWASIDNDDSRDLDQLTVAEPLAGGAVRLLVAVADVDALVARGCPLDEHARANTTSVYTAAQVFPMLPEKLSTDLTSLVAGEERVAVVVDMVIDPHGVVVGSDLYRARVQNRAKLAYNAVAAWLDGTGEIPPAVAAVPGLAGQLQLQDGIAQRLRQLRHAHGALTLETIEPQAVFEDEWLRDLRPAHKNRAQELIEDFMIAANGATARFLEARGVPALRRVLRTPERWPRIVALAAQFGASLPAEASALALNEFLLHRRSIDDAGYADLCLAVVKLLGRGEYVLELPGRPVAGHFGLAISDYTHATAPNRRFPDLITQRLLKSALRSAPPAYAAEELDALAAHCTAQEDNAAKVERQVRKSAAALLLSGRTGQRFDAVVTGAAPKGTWVRIDAPRAEGRLMRGFEGLDVGDRVRVVLTHTDIEHGFIDFERVNRT